MSITYTPYTWSWFFPSLIWNNQHVACPCLTLCFLLSVLLTPLRQIKTSHQSPYTDGACQKVKYVVPWGCELSSKRPNKRKTLKKNIPIHHTQKNLQTSQFDQELLQDQGRWRKFTFVSLGTYFWWLCSFLSSPQPWRTKTFCVALRKPTGSSLIKIMNLRFSNTVLPDFRGPWQKTFCSLFSV